MMYLSTLLAVIYYALVYKGLDVYFKYDDIKDMCIEDKSEKKDIPNNSNCWNKKQKAIREFNKNKFVHVMAIAILSIFIGAFLYNTNDTISMGLIIASSFMILSEIVFNWTTFDSKTRFVTYLVSFLGIALFITYYKSHIEDNDD